MIFAFYIWEDVIKARRAAIKAIDEIINNNKYSNYVIKDSIDEVDDLDKSIYRKIVYGVVENQKYLDYIISKLSKTPFKKLDKDVVNILRIAIYELIFLNSKEYAVINEAVKNTQKINFRLKGFVNGNLRSFLRDKERYMEVDIDDIDEYLSIRYSVNKSLILYLKKYYDNYVEIVKDFNNAPHMNIRVNTNIITRSKLSDQFKKYGFSTEESNISKDSLIVENPENIIDTEEFKKGLFTIQDQSSSLVSEILNPSEYSEVLDLCAAPGSKSTHIMQIMNNKGHLVSNDVSFNKLEKIKENFTRMNFKMPEITNYDASKSIEEFRNRFDYILVDAPCSGLGVIKRKPEIKIERQFEDIESLSHLQFEILENTYTYLKSGGHLVYSTCTLGDLENIDVVNKFLEKHRNLSIAKINGKDFIEILPSAKNDGFFICKIYKK